LHPVKDGDVPYVQQQMVALGTKPPAPPPPAPPSVDPAKPGDPPEPKPSDPPEPKPKALEHWQRVAIADAALARGLEAAL